MSLGVEMGPVDKVGASPSKNLPPRATDCLRRGALRRLRLWVSRYNYVGRCKAYRLMGKEMIDSCRALRDRV